MATYLVNCNVIDCVRSEPIVNTTVVVERGHIAQVRTLSRPSPGDEVIDLGGGFLLPGFWDAHAHLGIALGDPNKRPPHEPPASRTMRAAKNAIDGLKAGITSVRVVGEPDYVDVALRGAFDSGTWDGPRLLVCGRALATSGGHGLHAGLSVELDGPVDFRRGARLQLRTGANQLKLMATGGIAGSSLEGIYFTELDRDEIGAAVGVAHGRRAIVGAHVGNSEAAKLCIECGVDVIDHGYVLDDEAIDMMVKRGTYLVPTLCVTQLDEEDYRAAGWPQHMIENRSKLSTLHRHSFIKALEGGVMIASGEDMGSVAKHAPREVELLVGCGMSPLEALRAATTIPARMCEVADRLGTVEVGKYADLVATRKNPLESVSAVRSVFFVMKGGKAIRNDGDDRDEEESEGSVRWSDQGTVP